MKRRIVADFVIIVCCFVLMHIYQILILFFKQNCFSLLTFNFIRRILTLKAMRNRARELTLNKYFKSCGLNYLSVWRYIHIKVKDDIHISFDVWKCKYFYFFLLTFNTSKKKFEECFEFSWKQILRIQLYWNLEFRVLF